MGKRVLVVDDEKLIVKGIRFSLLQDGMEVDCAYDGEEALELAKNNEYDLLLLDVMLPKMDGFAVCQQIRDFSDVPIVMLTAKGDDMDKILGLEYGADDYITKPFDPEEVIARVEAAMRRYTKEAQNMEAEQEVFRYKNLSLYPQSRKVEVSGIELPLTMHEYDILYLLIQNPQKVYSREHLYEQVWKGGYYGEDNTVNVHVSNLRKKIQKADKEESYIKTVWGIGFKLE